MARTLPAQMQHFFGAVEQLWPHAFADDSSDSHGPQQGTEPGISVVRIQRLNHWPWPLPLFSTNQWKCIMTQSSLQMQQEVFRELKPPPKSDAVLPDFPSSFPAKRCISRTLVLEASLNLSIGAQSTTPMCAGSMISRMGGKMLFHLERWSLHQHTPKCNKSFLGPRSTLAPKLVNMELVVLP